MSTGISVENPHRNPCTLPAMTGIGLRIKTVRTNRKLSLEAVAARVGVKYQTIQDLENGTSRGTKHLLAIARALSVNPHWLETGQGVMETNATEMSGTAQSNHLETNKNSGFNKSEERAIVQDKIKVLGLAECGPDGWALWNGEVVDLVDRPPQLSNASRAYAVFVVGDSMEPAFRPGRIAYIHPDKPIEPGCDVLVQLHAPDGETTPRAVLKHLVRRSGDKVIVEQYNPPKTFTLKTKEIVSIHRVLGSLEA